MGGTCRTQAGEGAFHFLSHRHVGKRNGTPKPPPGPLPGRPLQHRSRPSAGNGNGTHGCSDALAGLRPRSASSEAVYELVVTAALVGVTRDGDVGLSRSGGRPPRVGTTHRRP